jgi:hypothetical protein
MGLLVVVSMALDFVTVTISFAGHLQDVGSANGLTFAGAGWNFHGVSVPPQTLLYGILIEGEIGLIFGFLLLVPSMRKNTKLFGIIVFIVGLLALIGGAVFYMGASIGSASVYGYDVVVSAGIGLWGVLIFAILEIIFAIPLMLKK